MVFYTFFVPDNFEFLKLSISTPKKLPMTFLIKDRELQTSMKTHP